MKATITRYIRRSAAPMQRGRSDRPPFRRRRDETGAALVLALVFVVAVGGIIGGLADLVTNDVSNSTQFASVRSLQYAATSATNLAIESIRYTPLLGTNQTLNASPPGSCGAPSSPAEGSEQSMAVWCSTAWNPTSADTRVVTLSTCPIGIPAGACALAPTLQAKVTFDDYGPGLSPPDTEECVIYCGAGMNVDSWLWSPQVPKVSSISTLTGPITGNSSTPITITGIGFVSGATTVNFIEESGGTPVSDNYAVAATVVSTTSTTVQADVPPVTEGTTFFVTVTTPSGTSAYGSSADTFQYQLAPPNVASINDNVNLSGSTSSYAALGATSGGYLVTINGTGFYTGATVEFVEESSGNDVPGVPSVFATDVSVISSTEITAVAPGVTSGTTYFVRVQTSDGLSAEGSPANDVFDYAVVVPIVSAVSPTSGPAGTSISITGSGFYDGATVYFASSDSCGTSNLTATNVNVATPTSITATVPSGLKSDTSYCVTVANGQNVSSNTVIYS
jgi:hypothetical protein